MDGDEVIAHCAEEVAQAIPDAVCRGCECETSQPLVGLPCKSVVHEKLHVSAVPQNFNLAGDESGTLTLFITGLVRLVRAKRACTPCFQKDLLYARIMRQSEVAPEQIRGDRAYIGSSLYKVIRFSSVTDEW